MSRRQEPYHTANMPHGCLACMNGGIYLRGCRVYTRGRGRGRPDHEGRDDLGQRGDLTFVDLALLRQRDDVLQLGISDLGKDGKEGKARDNHVKERTNERTNERKTYARCQACVKGRLQARATETTT